LIHRFDTDNESAAVAALIVYAAWRSRDIKKVKIKPDIWDRITRFIKASAKRANTIPEFLDALLPRLQASSLKPKWLESDQRRLVPRTGIDGRVEYVQLSESREFLTGILQKADHGKVIHCLFKETAWIVLLVRDRLETESAFKNEPDDEESL